MQRSAIESKFYWFERVTRAMQITCWLIIALATALAFFSFQAHSHLSETMKWDSRLQIQGNSAESQRMRNESYDRYYQATGYLQELRGEWLLGSCFGVQFVVFIIWLSLAFANLPALNHISSLSPGSIAILAFMPPINGIGLLIVMGELARGSNSRRLPIDGQRPGGNSAVVLLWWATSVLASFAFYFVRIPADLSFENKVIAAGYLYILALSATLVLVAELLAWWMFGMICQWQLTRRRLVANAVES